MQLQLQILKINTRSSHLVQYHLKDVQGKNHTKLENQECWHYFRMCSLGTQCDMFEYDASTSNCRYFPHLQLKNKRLVDFLQPHTNMHNTVGNLDKHWNNLYHLQNPKNIYFLECQPTGVNVAKGSDLITKSLFQDWTGLFGKKI